MGGAGHAHWGDDRMTRGAKRGAAAVAGMAAAAAVAALAFLWPAPEYGDRPLAPTLAPKPAAVAPGVFLLGGVAPAAAYAVETSDGVVLVDSGLDDSADGVTAQLAEVGLDPGRVRAVLLTHAHADHSLGAGRLRAGGARVYAGRGDCGPLRAGGPREAFFSTFHMPDRQPHPTAVDVELAGGEEIVVGRTRITALAAPGHTPGSICYLLDRGPDGGRVLFTGDVVQHLDGGPDTLGTYAAALPPLYRGDARDYLATLRRLRDLPAPHYVLPGHPRMDAEPQKPRIPPDRWQELLDRGIAEMERLVARFDADGADFLDGTPKELLPGLRYLGDADGAAVYALATPAGVVVWDPPAAGVLAERLKAAGWGDRKVIAALLTSADDTRLVDLPGVVAATGCRVVVGAAGVDRVRGKLPAGAVVVPADEAGSQGWFDGAAVTLQGRGVAPTAYRFALAGKAVLVSGRIPGKFPTIDAEAALTREVRLADGGAEAYVRSLDRLGQLKPDVWLPAVPAHGQNANLYDDDWAKVLKRNREALVW